MEAKLFEQILGLLNDSRTGKIKKDKGIDMEKLLEQIVGLAFGAMESDNKEISDIGMILYLILGAVADGRLPEFKLMCQDFFKEDFTEPKVFS